MTFDIFRVDWILVDSIIIFILILFLISIKLYKFKNRWRNDINNESLNQIALDPNQIKFNDNKVYIKRWNLTSSSFIKAGKIQLPTIFIYTSKSNQKLSNAIIEGLSSYGFIVIQIIFKRKLNLIKKNDSRLNYGKFNIISSAFKYLFQNDYNLNQKYWLIDFNSYLLLKDLENNNLDQVGCVLINPSVNTENIGILLNWLNSNIKFQINIIFNEKYYWRLRNRKISKLEKSLSKLTSKNINTETLEKSNKSFKYNETILLAKLIATVQNITNKNL